MTCEICHGAGMYYDWKDRDPIEGWKMASPRICQCDSGIKEKINLIHKQISALEKYAKELQNVLYNKP
jgi:hypothetical protein